MSILFTPASIGSVELKNRWVMLVLTTGFADENGCFTEREFEFYKRRIDGGVAAISSVAAVNQEGCSEKMHRMDADIDGDLRYLSEMAHKNNCRFIMQLFHAGRNRNNIDTNPAVPVCPSDIQSPIYRFTPRIMTEDDILRTIDDFAKAALKCKNCGVDIIEVSASVGYLLSQFMSPRVNNRTDSWGGSTENRFRFPTEVLKAIRAAVGPDYPVIAKISCGDMMGGYTEDDMISFINQLPPKTLDGLTLTGGWHEAPVPQMTYHVEPGVFRDLYHKVRRDTGLPVIACNRVNNQAAAEEMIENGDCDFAGAGRPLLTDPGFVAKMEAGIPYIPCQACNKGCIERVLRGKDCVCAFNPESGHEYLGHKKSKKTKRILVAGGGPVGLSAAKYEAENGNKVTIITDDDKWGGRVTVASVPPHKELLRDYVNAMVYELNAMGVEMIKGQPFDGDMVFRDDWDKVYIAFGAEPVIPEIPGICDLKHEAAEEYLKDPASDLGSDVIVVGGGTVGLETAETVAETNPGTAVTVVEALPKVGKDFGGKKWIMMESLKNKGVKILTETTITRADDSGVYISGNDGEKHLKADSVIFAAGYRPAETEYATELLKQKGIPFEIIGDCKKPSDIMNGLFDAYGKANDIERGLLI